MSKIDPNKLLISSDFYSVQGEGISSGVPSYFVRLGICNLTCGMSRAFANKLAEEVYGKGVNHDYEEGFVDGYNKAKETLYTKQDMIDLVQGLKDYTKESHTILGHDDREASDFVDIFLDYSNYQDNE